MSHTSLVGMLLTGSTILNDGLAVAAKAKHMHSDGQAILILGVYPIEMDILLSSIHKSRKLSKCPPAEICINKL